MADEIMLQAPNMTGGQLPDLTSILGQQPQPTQTIPPVQQDATVTAPAIRNLAMEHPDLAAAAVHHSRLAEIGNVIGNMLAGPTTPHLVQNPDGTMIVQQQPATTGEKWSRIAAAALLGASKGFAAGGGPLGAGRALGAGLQEGINVQPTQTTTAQGLANQSNQDMTTRANVAMLNQKMAIGQLQLAQAGMQLDKAFTDSQEQLQNFLSSHDGNVQHTHVNSEQEVMDWLQSHGMNAATDQDYRVVGSYNADRKSTGFDIYQVDRNWDERRAPAHTVDNWAFSKDEKGNWQIQNSPIDVPDRGQTNQQMWQAKTASALQYQQLQTQLSEIKTREAGAEHTAAETTTLLPAQVATQRAQAAYMRAQTAKDYYSIGLDAQGNPERRTDAQGNPLRGEAYLATLDPDIANVIRLTAQGEMKAPPPGVRTGPGMIIRKALANYDPNFSDTRYENMQNFKTKGDSTALTQLSTGLEHLDRALSNSSNMGFAPMLNAGRFRSGIDARYKEDADFLSGEFGKLVEGGAVSKYTDEQMKESLLSEVPTTRKAALDEMARLTKGKVDALYEKFRRGSNGMELPTQRFLSPDSIERMNRFGMGQGPTPTPGPGPGPGAGPTQIPTPAPPGPTPAPPAIGAVVNGYRYNGGPPSNPASWTAVAGGQ